MLLRLLLLLFAAAAPAAAPPPTIPHDASALLDFKAAADLDHRLRFPLRVPHCRWPGVRCFNATGGRVVRLVLDGRSLRGRLSLQGLDQLRVLSLSRNALAGPLPDLSPLLNLKSLFLSSNAFSGPFPSSLLHLPRLRTLDLSFNNFSGGLPPALAALPRLSALRLHSNRFSGLVPSFNQSALRSLNLSHNLLSGPVPATATLLRLGAATLAGNPGLCGEVVFKPCPVHIPFFSSGAAAATPSHPPHPPPTAAAAATAQLQGLVRSPPSVERHRHAAAIGGFAAGVALVLVLLVGFSLVFKRMHKRRRLPRVSSPTAATSAMLSPPPQPASLQDLAGAGDGDRRSEKAAAARNAERIEAVKSGTLVFCAGEAPGYSLDQLMRASAEMLGRGTMGTTYKAVMDGHLIVGVKRLDAGLMAGVGREAFDRHMGAVGNLRHPNLVPLRAFFQAKEERLLVYEYQPNGSLYSLIHGWYLLLLLLLSSHFLALFINSQMLNILEGL